MDISLMTYLDRARNTHGHLHPDLRARVFAAVNNPAEHWTDARSVIVGADGWTTLWQSVITATGVYFDHLDIPTTEQILAALEWATH
jgi:hypothetical protein